MSGDEKEQQIGRTVTEYQRAKVDLAHLEKKLKTVAEIYQEVSKAVLHPISGSGDYEVEDGKFKLRYALHENLNPADFILGHDALVALVGERDEAKKKADDLHAQLKSLGITSLE
jgi:predicted ATP-grasp superfamily ATP-dependent carboligase